jgi:hypothetical protein
MWRVKRPWRAAWGSPAFICVHYNFIDFARHYGYQPKACRPVSATAYPVRTAALCCAMSKQIFDRQRCSRFFVRLFGRARRAQRALAWRERRRNTLPIMRLYNEASRREA